MEDWGARSKKCYGGYTEKGRREREREGVGFQRLGIQPQRSLKYHISSKRIM
jgi:hypothetical protein